MAAAALPIRVLSVSAMTMFFFSGIAAFDERMFKVSIDGVPERVRGQYASGLDFELLGVRAIHGRTLTQADDAEPGRGGPDGPVAVISDSFWARRFARDPAVLGKSVQVGAQWVTVVGVTPPGFFGLQVGMPLDTNQGSAGRSTPHNHLGRALVVVQVTLSVSPALRRRAVPANPPQSERRRVRIRSRRHSHHAGRSDGAGAVP